MLSLKRKLNEELVIYDVSRPDTLLVVKVTGLNHGGVILSFGGSQTMRAMRKELYDRIQRDKDNQPVCSVGN